MSRYDAVIFDLFDTIMTMDSGSYRAVQRDAAVDLGVDWDEFASAWKATQQPAVAGVYENLADRCRIVLRYLNRDESGVKILLDWERKALSESCAAVPGIPKLMLKLARNKIRTGLISNASCAGPVILDCLDLSDLLDQIVFSFIEKLWKPDPRIYLLACDRLRSVPGRTAFVGDGDKNELEGASRAGLIPIHFDPTSRFPVLPVPPGTISCPDLETLTRAILN
ncbi:HAD family hydrolase [bacterium]|nr:HAD family hydrolase [candidate division CSSED10-310 bacterium]